MNKILKFPYLPIPNVYCDTLHKIVEMCLIKNPKERASIEDLLCIPSVTCIVFCSCIFNRSIQFKRSLNIYLTKLTLIL